MAIIIPEAQTPYSPAEQPRQNPNAPTGLEGLGQIGAGLVAIKAQKVQAENNRIVREARLGALQDLDQARIHYETTGDLDGLGDKWEAEASAIAGKYAAGVPKHLQKDFALGLKETVAPQTGAIRRREYALYQDRERASLNSDLRTYEKLAAGAPDEASRAAVLGDAAGVVGEAVDAGLISAVDADKILSDIPANASRIEAINILAEDPQAYLDRAEEFAGTLPPDDHARFTVTAKGAVAAEATRRQREDELLAATATKERTQKVDDAIDILESGRPYKDLPALLAEVAGTPEADRLQASIDAVGTETNFALMTPAEQKAVLDANRKAPTGNPADIGRDNRLEAIHTRTVESLKADPLAHIRDRGIAPVPPVDLSDPASVKARIAVAEAVTSEYTPDAKTILYFDQAEAESLSAELASPDPDRALGVVALIQRNFGDRAPLALAQIGAKDPTMHLAGALVLETGQMDTSRAILRGRQLAKEGKGAKIATEQRRSVEAELKPLFPPNDTMRLPALMTAADAHFAATGLGIEDPKSPEARAAYMASVQAVMAGTDQQGTKYGGIQPVNGKATALPARLTASEVEMAVNGFGADSWKRASLSGQPPLWGSKPMTDYDTSAREDLSLLSLGNGVYALGYTRADGKTVFMRDEGQKDGLFRFDLMKLIKGVSGGVSN
jgi:hypothetical protein